LRTEEPHPAHSRLDHYDTAALVDAFVEDQAQAALAVRAAAAALAQAVDAAVPRLRAGGRIVYVGAGTSGRLGVLDSVELHPTFSWPRCGPQPATSCCCSPLRARRRMRRAPPVSPAPRAR